MTAPSPEHTHTLSEINQKIIAEGETLPTVKLKDGSGVQTGTVATMLFNIDRYNKGEWQRVAHELELAIPTLVKIGLFDLFPPSQWICEKNPGRTYIGIKAMEYLNLHP